MRVIIFDQLGNVLNKFGCSKHLEFPNGVVVNDRQEIFISDNRAHCVKVFDYEGNFLRQIGGEGKAMTKSYTIHIDAANIFFSLSYLWSPPRDNKLPDWSGHQRGWRDHHRRQPQQLQSLRLLSRWPTHIRPWKQGSYFCSELWIFNYKLV